MQREKKEIDQIDPTALKKWMLDRSQELIDISKRSVHKNDPEIGRLSDVIKRSPKTLDQTYLLELKQIMFDIMKKVKDKNHKSDNHGVLEMLNSEPKYHSFNRAVASFLQDMSIILNPSGAQEKYIFLIEPAVKARKNYEQLKEEIENPKKEVDEKKAYAVIAIALPSLAAFQKSTSQWGRRPQEIIQIDRDYEAYLKHINETQGNPNPINTQAIISHIEKALNKYGMRIDQNGSLKVQDMSHQKRVDDNSTRIKGLYDLRAAIKSYQNEAKSELSPSRSSSSHRLFDQEGKSATTSDKPTQERRGSSPKSR